MVKETHYDKIRLPFSRDRQEERVRAYCVMAGLEIVAVIREEGVSAGKMLSKRPGGIELLNLIKRKQASHGAALKLDRLFRDAEDALDESNVIPRAVVKWIIAGKLKALKFSGVWRAEKEEFQAFLEKSRFNPDSKPESNKRAKKQAIARKSKQGSWFQEYTQCIKRI
ncbi:MAG: recombinase family protein [Candidatus Eremiobacteraeota bacterium]|nr:recombinase family protein [Candidatus Eremiobacteraeota bacterium]